MLIQKCLAGKASCRRGTEIDIEAAAFHFGAVVYSRREAVYLVNHEEALKAISVKISSGELSAFCTPMPMPQADGINIFFFYCVKCWKRLTHKTGLFYEGIL